MQARTSSMTCSAATSEKNTLFGASFGMLASERRVEYCLRNRCVNLVWGIIGEYCFVNPYWKSYRQKIHFRNPFQKPGEDAFENLFENVSGNMCRVRLWKFVSAAFAKPFSKIFSGSFARNRLEMLPQIFVMYVW